MCYNIKAFAGVVKLADTQDLGSCALWRGGSSPPSRTHIHIGPAVTVFVAAGSLVCALPGWVCLARLGVEPLS